MTQVSHAALWSGLGLLSYDLAGVVGAGAILTILGALALAVHGRDAV